MDAALQGFFLTQGERDAWLLSSVVKADPTDPVDRILRLQNWTPKHLQSAERHALIARFCDAAARLELREPDEPIAKLLALPTADLERRSGHADLVTQLAEERAKIEQLFTQGRKERSAGFMRCAKCKSTEVDVEQKQTRSADEPMTLFALCTNCGARWTMK